MNGFEIWVVFSPINVIFTLFALFAWSRAIMRFRDKVINFKELAFWSFVWVAAIVIVYIPGKATALAKLLGMGRGFDAMVFIAVVALFYAVYRLYMRANEAEQEMTRLVRQIALKIDIKEKGKTTVETPNN